MKTFSGNLAWIEAQKALADEWLANARRAAVWPGVALQAQRVK